MPIAPSNALSIPLSGARDLLASTSAWQSWGGWADAAASKVNIHLVAKPAPADGHAYTPDELGDDGKPTAVIDYDDGGGGLNLRRNADGLTSSWTPRGVVLVQLIADVPAAQQSDPGEAKLEFMNHVGAIVDQMIAGAGQAVGGAAMLAVNEIDVALGPWTADPAEDPTTGKWHGIILSLTWGL